MCSIEPLHKNYINYDRVNTLLSVRYLSSIIYLMISRSCFLFDEKVSLLLIGPLLTFPIVGINYLYSTKLSNTTTQRLLLLTMFCSLIPLIIIVYDSYYNYVILTIDVCWIIIAIGLSN